MTTVNIHEAKTHLSRLIEEVSAGGTVVIAKAGRPIAKLTRIDAPQPSQRLGFLVGQSQIPDDFDRLGQTEIVEAFEGHL